MIGPRPKKLRYVVTLKKDLTVPDAPGATVVGALSLVNRAEGAEALYRERGLPLLWVFTGGELLEAARAR